MMKRKLVEIMNNIPEEHLLECIQTFGYLNVKEKRKNVDYQWSEYIVYLISKGGERITIFEDFEKTFEPLIEQGYLTDLLKADSKKVMKYYNTFYILFHDLGLNVSNVFLLGKNQSKIAEIKKLHNENKNAKLKADVIVKTVENTFIGFSVKSSEQDTLTNYSVYKMLPKDEVALLKEIQLSIIKRNGLSVMKGIYKQNREKYNKLFANSTTIDNEYHITLNELILDHKEEILEQWYKNLFGSLPYELYTFNGTTLTNDAPSPEFINIKPVQNPAKKDNTSAAKLFYAVYDKENASVPLYKWEIRWKGDIFVSPQILTFKWNPEKDYLKIIKALK
jgi:hypothetical protein